MKRVQREAIVARENVLFLCNHNSARSIMAEALLNDIGGERFCAFSAGTRPAEKPHPIALETLAAHGHSVAGLGSKSVATFTGPGAMRLDYVITLCDSVVNEECPDWPGQPKLAHWRLPNPAAISDPDKCRAAFEELYEALLGGLRIFAEDDARSLRRMAVGA